METSNIYLKISHTNPSNGYTTLQDHYNTVHGILNRREAAHSSYDLQAKKIEKGFEIGRISVMIHNNEVESRIRGVDGKKNIPSKEKVEKWKKMDK